jgi:hypothetical protein
VLLNPLSSRKTLKKEVESFSEVDINAVQTMESVDLLPR